MALKNRRMISQATRGAQPNRKKRVRRVPGSGNQGRGRLAVRPILFDVRERFAAEGGPALVTRLRFLPGHLERMG